MKHAYALLMTWGWALTALWAQVEVKVTVLDSATGKLVRSGVVTMTCPDQTMHRALAEQNPAVLMVPPSVNCTLDLAINGMHYRESLRLDRPRHRYLWKTATAIRPVEDVASLMTLREAVVSAVRTRPDDPVPSSALGTEQIETQNVGKDIPFLLTTMPAVVAASDAGMGVGYTGFRIRGIDMTRINVTLNGIPLNDAESHGVWWVDLPDIAASTDMIQLQRGLGMTTYGGGGLGANLNISTEGAAEKPMAKLYQTAGAYRTFRTALKAATGRLPSGWGWTGRVSRIHSDGWIDRAFSNLTSYYLAGEYFRRRTRIHLIHFGGKENTYQAWYGVPIDSLTVNPTVNEAGTERPGEPYDNETDNYWQYHWQAHLSHQQNNWTLRLSSFYTRGYGYYEQYKAGEDLIDYGAPPVVTANDTITSTDLVRQLWLDNHFYGGIASATYADDYTTATIGAGAHRYDGRHYGKVIWAQWAATLPKDHKWYDLDARKDEQYAFVKVRQRLSSEWTLMADAMLRSVQYRMNGFRDHPALRHRVHYLFPNPRIGFTWQSPSWGTLRLFAGLGHKEPNRDDYEASPQHLPSPERMFDVELGWRYQKEKSRLDITVYDMEYRDQLVLTGKINDVGAYTRENVPESFRRGVEIEGAYQIFPTLRIKANYAFNDARIKRYVWYVDDWDTWTQDSMVFENVPAAFSPRHVGAAVLAWQPLPSWKASLETKYVGKQYLDNTQNPHRSLAPYLLLNARLRYSAKLAGPVRKITAGLDVFNLLNKVYAANGWTYVYRSGGREQAMVYVYPQAPRHAMVSLLIEF